MNKFWIYTIGGWFFLILGFISSVLNGLDRTPSLFAILLFIMAIGERFSDSKRGKGK